MINITPKVAALGLTSLCLMAAGVAMLDAYLALPTGVKGVATTTITPKTTQKSPATSAAVEAPASPDKGTQVIRTASTATVRPVTPASTTASGQPAGTSAGSIVAVTPPPAPAPAPTPTPSTPKPSYRIVLREDDAYVWDMSMYGTDAMQLVVPFDIVYDEGFVKADYRQPGCRFVVAPTANHGVLCDLHQKEADSGSLVMQYDDASAEGYYKVEAIYPIGDTTRTATYEFELAALPENS